MLGEGPTGSGFIHFLDRLFQLLLALEALLPPEVATVLEHIPAIGVESPETSFPGLVRGSRDFHKAVVEAERVTDGILPALLILSESTESDTLRGKRNIF